MVKREMVGEEDWWGGRRVGEGDGLEWRWVWGDGLRREMGWRRKWVWG